MRNYLLKILLFFTFYCIIYFAIFWLADNGIKKSEYRDFAEWNEIFQGKINADVLVLGSSRAWRQVNPKILDSNLNVNSYNLGIDGYQIPMQIAKYNFYRNYNDKPKHIIYVVDHFSFWRRENTFNKEQFLPYISDTTLWNELCHYKGFSWADHFIPYYQYIGSKEVAIAGILESLELKSFEKDKYKGFRSSDKTWEPEFDIELKENPNGKRAPFNLEVYLLFEDFLQKCKESNIKVTIVYSPEYIEFQHYIKNREEISYAYSQLSKKFQIDYIDYKTHHLCFDKKYFYNPTHLNALGADIFTRDLVYRIKNQN